MGKLSELEENINKLIELTRKLKTEKHELEKRNQSLQVKIDEGIKSLSQAEVKDQLIKQLKNEVEFLKQKQETAKARVMEMINYIGRLDLKEE